MIFKKILYHIFIVTIIHITLFADFSLTRVNANEPNTLYPAGDNNALAGNIRRDLFEPLMTKDRDGNIILGQAKSYKINKSKTIYTFILRDDIYWSDGTPVTAYDFEYAYRYMADPKNHIAQSQYLRTLNILNSYDIATGKKTVEDLGVNALDTKTLKIILENPTYYLLEGLSQICMSPISKKNIEIFGNILHSPQNLLSNGAYQLQTWKKGEKIVLKKNLYYYDAKKVQIESVTYLPIDKESRAFKLYESGKVDYLDEIPKNRYKQLKKKYPNELKTSNLLGTFYLSFNLKKRPFDNPLVRKALSYAIDRESLAKKVMGTGEKPLYTFMPKGINTYIPTIPLYQKWTQKERETKAQAFLKEAGFTIKNPLQFELLYNINEQNRRVLLTVIAMWKKVFEGQVYVKLKALDWNSYQKERQNYAVVRLGWIADINDASNMLEIFTEKHIYNHASYKNSQFEKLLTQAKATDNEKERVSLYQKLDLMLVNDMPVAPLFQFTTARLIKPYILGYKNTPLDTVFSKYLWIEKSHD